MTQGSKWVGGSESVTAEVEAGPVLLVEGEGLGLVAISVAGDYAGSRARVVDIPEGRFEHVSDGPGGVWIYRREPA